MATVAWDTMFPLLAPYLPAVPDAVMRSALAASAADFLGRTHLWRQVLDPIITAPGESEYELYADAVIESVLTLRHENVVLRPVDPRKNAVFDSPSGTPLRYWMVGDTTVRLYPAPDKTGKLECYAALKPSRTASGVESWVYETWADALADGAIWQLARIPSKPWSDAQMALEHKTRFDRAIVNARTRDLQQINLRVQGRAF